MSFEYKLHWEASSNSTFSGSTGWRFYDGLANTKGEVEEELTAHPDGGPGISVALEEVLEACGFNWWLEVR